MIPFSLPNAASSVIAPTGTAATLQALIRTAASSTTYEVPQDADAIDIYVETIGVRVLFDDVSPTAANGFLIPSGSRVSFRGPKLSKMRLISIGATASASIIIGRSVPGLMTA